MSRAESGKISLCLNALFLQDHLGGIGNYTFHLLTGIRRARPAWDLYLLVHAGTAPRFAELEGVRLIVVPWRARWKRLFYFHVVFPFRARRFDLVHSVGNMGMAFCPAPQVITVHDLYERVSPERFSPGKRLLMRCMISWSGRRAAAVIAVSENTRRDLARFYPGAAARTTVIHSGRKFPLSPGEPAEDRRDLLFVGTIEPGKNLRHILEAFALFAVRHPEGRLKVVGAAGWGQSALPSLIERLGIRDRVDFLGYVSDGELARLYAGSQALIMASAYEGFGLPIIEAMACGCPVIAARNSGMREAGGEAALFFETGDIAGLAERMEKVAGSAEARRAAIEAGLRHAAHFTWERAVEETLAVYASVAGR